MESTFAHPFLSDEQFEKLKRFSDILQRGGKMKPLTDDGEILLTMAMNNVQFPPLNHGDNHQVLLFSDKNHCYIVAKYANFEHGDNGYGGLRIDREYLMREFMPLGDFKEDRANKITDGLLSILLVDPRQVELDMGEISGKQNGRIVL